MPRNTRGVSSSSALWARWQVPLGHFPDFLNSGQKLSFNPGSK
eukprot:CAMPEP_0176018514 /NCGR_PEP_ID=MMETSP0120_2-20121206/8916_1 /TAXON_ID=160619 /ORGANISM="Kryptoperidinium foliaceum, Strain CCMP 1326" /LENGTH=42 /DNA_ID= /DNA_START= /DNA_END= /DNA_ORIENTATION=